MTRNRKTGTAIGLILLDNQRDLRVSLDDYKITRQIESESHIETETLVFYKLLRTRDEFKFDYEETGLGEFIQDGKNIIFKRHTLFSYTVDGIKRRCGNKKPTSLESEYKYVFYESAPENYKDLLSSEDSVICSTDPYKPTPVRLQDKTLLGKLEDRLQSIDKYELWSILTEYLINEEKVAVKGSIRYNTEDDCFEGYDGTRWRSLMWGEK